MQHDPSRHRSSVASEPANTDPGLDPALAQTDASVPHSPSPQSQDEFPRGAAIDRFIVVDFLGRGAMGVVVKAYDPDLDRKVAIKVLRADLAGDPDASSVGEQRLFREAQAMAKLSHPNVVTVHEVGTVSDRVFLVMEYVEGQTLGGWLQAAPRSWREVIEVFAQAGCGLAAAHGVGVVHRDFKPDNVLVRKDGRVLVSDFGLASAAGILEARASMAPGVERHVEIALTEPGTLLGTPMYMAPEQHLRLRADGRADQFSFCVALYEAIYGKSPYPEKTYFALQTRVIKGDIEPPPSDSPVPAWVRDAVLRGLNPKPEARFQSMNALVEALAASPTRSRTRWLAIAAVLVMMTTVGSLLWTRHRATLSRCSAVSSELDGVWDASAKTATKQAFLGTGRSNAQDTFERIEQQLDGYSQRWIAMRTQVCREASGQAKSLAATDVRTACLVHGRTQMATLAGLFQKHADPDLIDDAVEAVCGLPSLDACDGEAIGSTIPLPDAPDIRSKVEELRRKLDEVETLERAGKYQLGLDQATAVVQSAQNISYHPIQAEALYGLGRIQEGQGDAKAAERSYKSVLPLAAEAGYDLLIAKAWVELILVVGTQTRYSEVPVLLNAADTAIARAGNDQPLSVRKFHHVGVVLGLQGRYEEAKNAFASAVSIGERVLGPEDFVVVSCLNNLGLAYKHLGEYELARKHLLRSLDIRVKTVGPDHPFVAGTLHNLGLVDEAESRFDDAWQHHQSALAMKERLLGPLHGNLVTSLVAIGRLLVREGKYQDARASYQRALDIGEARLGHEHPYVAQTLTGLGECAFGMNSVAESITFFEKALAIWDKKPGDPLVMATTHFGLAKALWESARTRDRALALAVQARQEAASSLEDKTQLVAIDSWIAEHDAAHKR